jgi:NifU-like protein involved in Fe-S cluster formation
MSGDIDVLIQKFQEEMLKQARENYGDAFLQRWQHPMYMGALAGADVSSSLKGTCGDTILISLKFRNGSVEKASFQTDGCAPSIVCGSYAAELSIGKSPEELLEISAETIVNAIGRLPQEVQHCAFLAAATVHSAVDKYIIKQIRKDKDTAAKEDEKTALNQKDVSVQGGSRKPETILNDRNAEEGV